MTNRIEFQLPIGTVATPEGDGALWSLIDASIAVAYEDEAPLVAHWDGGEHGEYEFRAWNGGLVATWLTRPQDVASILGRRWTDVEHRDRARMLRWPYFGLGSGLAAVEICRYEADSNATPDLARTAALASERLKGSVVVGGRVWVPTTGPRLQVVRDTGRMVHLFSDQPDLHGPFRDIDAPFHAWSVFDRDEILMRVNGTKGVGVVNDMSAGIDVLSWDGWSLDAIHAESDELVLDSLLDRMATWRNSPLGKADAEMLEAVIGLRAAKRPKVGNDLRSHEMPERMALVENWFEMASRKWGKDGNAAFDLSLFRMDMDRISQRLIARSSELAGFSI